MRHKDMMKKRYIYKNKNVHDIPVGNSFVRLWHHGGGYNEKQLVSVFEKIVASGAVWPYIALMPDFHPGDQAMIGSVIPLKNKVMPSLIGNDIGCGMLVAKIGTSTEDIENYDELLARLKQSVPTGFHENRTVTERVAGNAVWGYKQCVTAIKEKDWRKLYRQLGTLGGGNHFIELLKDDDSQLWIIIHTGSRYAGELIRKQYSPDGLMLRQDAALTVESKEASEFIADHDVAVLFAKENRQEILVRVLHEVAGVLKKNASINLPEILDKRVDVVHNAVFPETHFGESLYVHRKGAVRLFEGEKGVIPGSAGTSSCIVEGRGNSFSFNSSSHGAGRKMSRKEAATRLSAKDIRRYMTGIVYDSSLPAKDEAPQAYKDIRKVMKAQKDSVRILCELTPVLSFKG